MKSGIIICIWYILLYIISIIKVYTFFLYVGGKDGKVSSWKPAKEAAEAREDVNWSLSNKAEKAFESWLPTPSAINCKHYRIIKEYSKYTVWASISIR